MFDRLISRYRGRHDWPSTAASIASVTFRASGRDFSYYDVFFTFWVEGHIYSGTYTESVQGSSTVQVADTVTVLYNPNDPNINFNPDFDTLYNYGLKPFLMGGIVLLAAIGFVIFVVARK